LLIEEYFLSLERVLASYSQIQRVTLTPSTSASQHRCGRRGFPEES